MSVDDRSVTDFPFAPARLWKAEWHGIIAGKITAGTVQLDERDLFPVTQEVRVEDRGSAIKPVDLRIIVGPFAAKQGRASRGGR